MKWIKKVYKWELSSNRIIQTSLRPAANLSMQDADGVCWAVLDTSGKLIVGKGYAWDGATPRVKIAGRVVGTWNGLSGFKTNSYPSTREQQLYIPTLGHDVCYQFKEQLATVGISLKDVDTEFLLQCQAVGFEYAGTYYRMVRVYSCLRYSQFQELNKDN